MRINKTGDNQPIAICIFLHMGRLIAQRVRSASGHDTPIFDQHAVVCGNTYALCVDERIVGAQKDITCQESLVCHGASL